jgi:hypothetical protein
MLLFSELSSYDPQIQGNSIQFFTNHHAKIGYDNLKNMKRSTGSLLILIFPCG